MQFLIKQKVFAWADAYTITDVQGNPVFQVKSHVFSIGHKMDLLDMTGRQVAHIQQRVLVLAPEYDIYQGGQLAAVVKKHIFTLIHPRFSVDGPGGVYDMAGDWLNWNYNIAYNGQPVAQISKQFSLVRDSYVLDVANWADIPLVVCLVIVMDEVAHPDESGNNTSW